MTAGTDTFCYDPNGNMTSRSIGVTYTLSYDAENRLRTVTNTAAGEVITFTYDADSRRVIRETVTDTIVYVGSHYEVRFEEGGMPMDLNDDCVVNIVDIMLVAIRWGMTEADPDWDPRYDLDGDGEITVAGIMKVAAHWRRTCEDPVETVKYYTLGGRRVAMRKESVGQADTLYYLFSDHLGSTSVSYRADGQQTITQRYYPWGTVRPGPDNALPTDYTFTGQKLDESTGLMYYGARYYDAALGRFVQADTIVPNPGNPQDLNRYAYVRNNPVRYTDPSGLWLESSGGGGRPSQEQPVDLILLLEWHDDWIAWLRGNPQDCGDCAQAIADLEAGRTELAEQLCWRSYEYYQAHPEGFRGEIADALFMFAAPAGKLVGDWASDEIAAVRIEVPERVLQAGEAGRFGDLDARRVTGDDLTPHHMPQKALGETSEADGGALVMTTAEHAKTRTYGARGALTVKQDAGMSFRDVLAADIRDVRSIVGSRYNEGLVDLINYYRINYPHLMEK